MTLSRKYWCVVVSKEHVEIGRQQGIVQACHGKKHPLVRMQAGDDIVFYSPKKIMGAKEPYKFFTAIGKISPGDPYLFDMGGGFVPYRKDVEFEQHFVEVSLAQALATIERIDSEKPQWIGQIRFGFFELPKLHFETIASLMLCNI